MKSGEEKIPINLYSKVRNDIVNRFSNYDCVKAIYEFGKTNNVGISDLDIALVLKKETQEANYLQEELQSVYENQDYISVLCGGTIMVFSESDFANIHYFDDIELKLLAGNKIRVNRPSQSEEKLILICQIIDWLPERLLSLKNAVVHGNSAISLLGYLYSIRYTFKKINKFFTSGFKERIDFVASIETIRSKWFNLGHEEQSNELNMLLESAFSIGFNDLCNFEKHMKHTGNYQSEDDKLVSALFSLTSNKKFFFLRNGECSQIKDEQNTTQNIQIEVPSLWFYLWFLYGCQPGPISQELSRHLHIEPANACDTHISFNEDLENMLIKRIALCNSMAGFLKRNGIKKGLYKFGWFF